jgi:adenine deaminase
MKIQIREGSAAKNFDALSFAIDEYENMCMVCSDDKYPHDLVESHINEPVKGARNHQHLHRGALGNSRFTINICRKRPI